MTLRRKLIYLGVIAALLLGTAAWYSWAFAVERKNAASGFDARRAYADVLTQVSFGPRIPGSRGHARAVEWMRGELEAAGWQVEIQQSTSMGHPIQNIRAYRSDAPPRYILGAHYDTRLEASNDADPSRRAQPVLGANDGASGVAVLLELARTLPRQAPPVWLVFFDAEDNGKIPGWDWILGSRAFVASLQARPQGMVLLDMVGSPDLSLPIEGNSDPALQASIWRTAAELGHADVFLPRSKYTIEDDHVPFLEAGIPAVDIIDIDYPYWHTTGDTPEHVSERSLQIVGDVLWTWLVQQGQPR